jgi:hypothetical protein
MIPIKEDKKEEVAREEAETWDPREEVPGCTVTWGQRSVCQGAKDKTYKMRCCLGSRWHPYDRKGSDVDSDREEYCSGPFQGVGSIRQL